MKRRSRILILILLALVYVVIAVRTTKMSGPSVQGQFLSFSQAHPVSELPVSAKMMLPFASGGHLGYIDPRAGLLYAQLSDGRVAIDGRGWISYSRSAGPLELHDLTKKSAEIQAFAYPWFKSSWRMLVRGDQMGIANIDAKGAILWQREFPVQITAIDANSKRVVVGLLDGSIYVYDENGNRIVCSSQNLGGIRTVYGLAISESGDNIVAVSGLSPQNIETFKRENNAYVFAHASTLEKSSVLQASVALSADGSHALIARGSEVLYYSVKFNIARPLSLPRQSDAGPVARGDPLYYALGAVGSREIAILRTSAEDLGESDVVLLKDGLFEREWAGGTGIAANSNTFAVVFQDGVELR